MAHKPKKSSTGSWAGNRDQHQGGEKRKTDAEKRLAKPDWVKQGKHTSENNKNKGGKR